MNMPFSSSFCVDFATSFRQSTRCDDVHDDSDPMIDDDDFEVIGLLRSFLVLDCDCEFVGNNLSGGFDFD